MPLHFCLPDTISREEVLHALLASRGDRGLAGCRVGLTCYFDTLIHQLYPLVPGVTPRLGSGRWRLRRPRRPAGQSDRYLARQRGEDCRLGRTSGAAADAVVPEWW